MMLRSRWPSVTLVGGKASTCAMVAALRFCALQMPKDQRELMTKSLSAVREEAKGQALDLTDMAEASRAVAKQLQDALKKVQVDDSKFKGKSVTLSASIKAYNTRLSNLQNEARFIQGEIDGMLKLIWGTDAPQTTATADATPAVATKTQDDAKTSDFDCDVPPIARRLEQINELPPKGPQTTTAPSSSSNTRKPEVVEGEVIRGDQSHGAQKQKQASTSSDIEVESIEIEVEPEASSAASPEESMSITEITKDLYDRGVNFSDCLDAKTLRQRYRDVLQGRIASSKPSSQGSTKQQPAETATTQPPPPPRPQYHQQQYQQAPPNTTESSLAHDPYPNAHRKMIDPMKYVWEIKQDLAKEKNIDPNSVDLWSGKSKLEDHKRLYDYPSIQSYPIEVRQKGDAPR